METEKVKEIKKALECAIQVDLDKFSLGASLTDCLDLIDELEQENKSFKEKQSKAEEIMKSGELSKITKQDMYYYYLTNCGYLEKEIERQKQIVSNKGKAIEQFKDRIAELKSKNERLNKALVDNLEAYKDGFNEGAGLKKGVDNKLKTENQQLKDRIAKLENKIENGALIELPCKVGDMVYEVFKKHKPPFIQETTIEKIIITEKGFKLRLSRNSVYETAISSLGRTIFLTEAEAEAKLKELQNETN